MVRLPFVAVQPRAVKALLHQRIRLLISASALVTMDVQAPRSKAALRIPGPSVIPTAIVLADSVSSTKSFISRQTVFFQGEQGLHFMSIDASLLFSTGAGLEVPSGSPVRL